MSQREKLRLALLAPASRTAVELYDLALDALDHDLSQEVIFAAERALASGHERDRRLWQVLGLAHRDGQNSAEAYAAFSRAAALAPLDALIAHSRARTALEAGFPASRLFEHARTLASGDGGLLLGFASAMLADGNALGALALLSKALAANPGWHEGHIVYARIAAVSGAQDGIGATVRAALKRYPGDLSLRSLLIRILLEAKDYHSALQAADAARAALGPSPEWTRIKAICLGEMGQVTEAQSLFDALPSSDRVSVLLHPMRNLIRLGRFDEALAIAERRFPSTEEAEVWPYRALLWRIMGDARWTWLEGDQRLIGVHDIAGEVGDMTALADMLRELHKARHQPIDQSVRGGSQTDGNLFVRAEPEIRRLRAAILGAVEAHVAQLPAPVDGHPTLANIRAPVRFAGAWSVRLVRGGVHVDHVHPQGWLSSAFYVALPGDLGSGVDDDTERAGWLTLGECRSLVPDLDGFRYVEPKMGRLVLFPSTMWHGTRPFERGERLTVAFDVAHPQKYD